MLVELDNVSSVAVERRQTVQELTAHIVPPDNILRKMELVNPVP